MEKNMHNLPLPFPVIGCLDEMHFWKLSLKVWVFSWGIISKRKKSVWIKECEFSSSYVPSSLNLTISGGNKRNQGWMRRDEKSEQNIKENAPDPWKKKFQTFQQKISKQICFE